ncbi:MAG: tetratricopeptide repeat protein [Planctomycetota bacterium]|jgi:tetratricopeptide (TPR) repeat protein
MKRKTQFIGLMFLICTLAFIGCESGKTKPLKEIALTPAEQEKAALLKQLDRRFENPEGHYKLGKLYQADGLWSQAEHEYTIALSFDPVHRQAQAARVKVLLNSGDTGSSEFSANFYMNQASINAESSLRLAMAFQKEMLDEYAMSCYQQALRLAPSSAKINRQMGYYYLSKGDRARAQDYLTRSFQLNSQQPEVAGELGRLGVPVRIPRKTQKSTKTLDRIIEQSDKTN